jgi:hypothetical protein
LTARRACVDAWQYENERSQRQNSDTMTINRHSRMSEIFHYASKASVGSSAKMDLLFHPLWRAF